MFCAKISFVNSQKPIASSCVDLRLFGSIKVINDILYVML